MKNISAAKVALELKIGQEVGVSQWIKIDQSVINRFAETTYDDQWIHVSPERVVRETSYGGTIAHGFLTLSLASRFSYDCLDSALGQVMSINYGFNKLRFITPVKVGSRLRGRFKVSGVVQKSSTDLLREMALTIEIEDENKPAIVADWLSLAIYSEET